VIAAGQAVAIVSAGLRASILHPALTTVPLEGVDPVHVVPSPAPTTAAGWWRPSANAPRPTSLAPAPE
jgi:hypothetical protein